MNYPQIFYPTTENVNSKLKDHSGYTNGYTESYFNFILHKYFNGFILTNKVIDDGKSYPYKPDYIINIPEHNLFIDLEIDEPYVYKTKQPIHFNDDKRNTYFQDNGWSIIRFSEEQICKYPNLCCKIISEHIGILTGESIWVEGFYEMGEIEMQKAWTKEDALKLANKSARQGYLTFLQKIENKEPQISVFVDGIYLNKALTELRNEYKKIWPKKNFPTFAKVTPLITELSKYFSHFSAEKDCSGKIYVEFRIFISGHHSIYNLSFDSDIIYIDNYIINVYYVRTKDLICFEIIDYKTQKNIKNIILIADDPSYSFFIKKWTKEKLFIVRDRYQTFMPDDIRYINRIYPLGKSLGLKDYEL